jgi:hypothetical protein
MVGRRTVNYKKIWQKAKIGRNENMTSKIARRDTFKLVAAGAAVATTLGMPAIASAGTVYPSGPITLINPHPPAGYNDNLGRLIYGPLGKVLSYSTPHLVFQIFR